MKLHFKSAGSGDPVIILHGLFGMLDNWATFARYLSETFQVFTVDLRNHGRSPHAESFNYDVLAEDIREFILEHNLAPATLMGHSLGGKTAMLTALRWPDLVDKLIVVDMAPKAYVPQHDQVIAALEQTDPASAGSRTEIEEALVAQLEDIGVARFLMKNVARDTSGKLHWRMNLPILIAHYAETTRALPADLQYPGPALFVRGGNSRYILDADMELIRKLFPVAF